jgi:uncharacterized protein
VLIEFDPAKNAANIEKHGISLAAAEDFDLSAALITPDDRWDYGERRWQAIGRIGAHLYALVFTMRGMRLRAISLRRASPRERRDYAEGS